MNCSIPNCPKLASRVGLCIAHYTRLRRHGDPLKGKTLKTQKRVAKHWIEAHVSHVGDGCLTWPFSCFQNGRAQLEYGGKTQNAARVMCTLAHGDPPSPKSHAAHSCGNGHLGCVHPQHIEWKTARENEADKIKHGTTSRGERNGYSKLTDEAVAEIRRLKGQETQRSLAKRFGVTQPNIGYIHRGVTWRD
jgi:hypothetical protein